MSRAAAITFLVVGVILLIVGLNAADSIGSLFSRLFTGAPTDKAIWLVLGGIVGVLMGSLNLLRGKRA